MGRRSITKRTPVLLLWVIFLLILGADPIQAQEGEVRLPAANVRFERLSLEDGLPHISIQNIFQDSRGFMWFGTLDGAAKYDGYEFTVYKHDPTDPTSISDNRAVSFYEDKTGYLWIGTGNGGLNKFDPVTETFTRYEHQPDNPHSLSHNSVTFAPILSDTAGNLWIGTLGGGLNKFDPSTETFTHFKHEPLNPNSLSNNNITTLSFSGPEKLWVGTHLGLHLFDLTTEIFTHFKHDPADPNSISHNGIRVIYSSPSEPIVWISTLDNTLHKFDIEQKTFTAYTFTQTPIDAIYETEAGFLWLGSREQGLSAFDPVTEAVIRYTHNLDNPHSLSNNSVFNLYQDRAGALWIGTLLGGVNRLDLADQDFQLYQNLPNDPESLASSDVFTLYTDQAGVVWVGTMGGGLHRFNVETGTFTRYQHNPDDPRSISSNMISILHEDDQGRFWVGTWGGGLNLFDREREIFTHYIYEEDKPNSLNDNNIWSITSDEAGWLWLGMFSGGLNRFNPKTGTAIHYLPDPQNPASLSYHLIWMTHYDSSGSLWVGTDQGLDLYDPSKDGFIHYRQSPEGLSHNIVKVIYEDNQGILWLATDAGLNRFDRMTGEFTHYTKQDGLPVDRVSSIVPDDEGYLWLGTGGGLSRFDPRTETFINYDRLDGLQDNLFNYKAATKDADGRLYFGGAQGLNVFHPNQLSKNSYIPPVVLTDFQLFNESVSIGPDSPLSAHISYTPDINLTHDQSILAFEFAALNYTVPEKNQYAYMLEGFDRDWTTTNSNRRFARYTNLDPGSYTFRVKASNNDGLWNETDTSVKVIITPPWWETAWFRSLALVLVVGLVWGGFQWRMRSVERQRRQLATQVDERTKELQASEAALRQSKQAAEAANRAKSIFLANMSHELRTPLNTILGYAQMLDDRPTFDPEVTDGVKTIRRSGDHLLNLIDEVLDIAKIEADQIDLYPTDFHLPDFVDELAEMIHLRADRKDLNFRFETDHFDSVGSANGSTNGQMSVLPAMVRGDARRLRQVLLNLLNNAVKFTDQGQVIFRVRLIKGQDIPGAIRNKSFQNSSLRPTPYALLRFEVEDTGPGILSEELERIFEPFQQTRQGQQASEGAGLGLTISRRLVEMMGSQLQVRSTVGQGSLFWFELSLPIVEPAKTAEIERQRIIGIEGQRPKILIIDDIADNRASIAKHLTRLGFEVAEAGNGADGLAQARDFKPAGIILDRMMPDLDGLELIPHLRQLPGLNESVIIVSSASVFEADWQQSLAAGSDDFLPKPVKIKQLLPILARHLDLQWRYEERAKGSNGHTLPSMVKLSATNIPAPDDMAHLYQLAMMGHVVAIQEKAVELAQLDKRLTPFTTRVERLAERFQINELCDFLEQYLER